MSTERQPKPTIDAINDAVGAVSDLLHSLRAHARAAAREVKSGAKVAKRDAEKAGRGAVRAGKKAVRRAEAGGEGLLDKAAKAWHDITGSDGATAGATVATRKRAPKRRTRK